MRLQHICSLLAAILVGELENCAASGNEHADTPVAVIATDDSQDVDKAEIYSLLIHYCRYSLETTSNDVARCQLYAHWGRALEKKLELQRTDFATMRREVVQLYLNGLQVIAAQQRSKAGDPTDSHDASGPRDRKERLPQFRTFFRHQIVALYNQPPNNLEELNQLVSRTISDKSLAQEIMDANEFKRLRVRHH